MSQSAPESSPQAPRQGTLKALTARAGDHWFAFPLSRVRRVIQDLKLHPLPGAGDVIAGLAEVDGEPLVILSLERLTGAPPGPSGEFPVTLLVAAGPEPGVEVVGLIAEEAGGIVRIDEETIVGPPKGILRGEVRLDQDLVRVLDPGLLGAEA